MLDLTGQVGTPYSSSIAVTGSEPYTVEVTGGALPPSLTFTGVTLAGTPTAFGTFYFGVTVLNACGTDSNWYGITIDGILTDFVWGDPWSFKVPEVDGATYYIEHVAAYPGSYDTRIPANFAASTVGALGNPGRTYYGTTEQNATLGPTRVWIDGWNQLSGYPDYPGDNVGVSIDATVNTYFRIYWGDWDIGLPAEFTAANILSLTHGGVAGPSTRLCTTARNQELEFLSTASAKPRVIVIPVHVNSASGYAGLQADKYMNTVRAADHTPMVLDPSADVPYQGGYQTDYNELIINGIQHWVYVIPATSSAFSVWLRFVEQASHAYSVASPATPWSQALTVPRHDPDVGELISVEITLAMSWLGSLWFENTSTAGTRTLTANLDALAKIQVAGSDALSGTTTSTFTPPTLSAFDGSFDYSGTSAYKYADRTGSSTPSISLGSGDAGFSEFVGTGDADVVAVASHSVTVNPIAGVSDPGTLSIFIRSHVSTSGHVTFTYFKP